MDNQTKRELILHYAKLGQKPAQIHKFLLETYGQDAPSYKMVKDWCNQHKWGRTDTKTRPSTGRPLEVPSTRLIELAERAVRQEPKISCRMLAQQLNLSRPTTKSIVKDHLGLEKIHGHWIPHALNSSQKMQRVQICKDLYDRWAHRWSEFKARLITQDETWILYDQPETPRSSAEWLPSGSKGPECPRLAKTNDKLMMICFWDCKGLIYSEYFKSSKNRPGLDKSLYCAILDRMVEHLRQNNRAKWQRKILLLHDNAPCHTSSETKAKLQDLQIETLPHPPYSPDLAPSDYYLFGPMKNQLKKSRKFSQEEVEAEIKAYFDAKPESFFNEGINRLKSRWLHVIELNGSYIQD